ncbi:MAG TPA: Asp23/Gls24 family envelope stress response protein [Thermoleophilia bacterium]
MTDTPKPEASEAASGVTISDNVVAKVAFKTIAGIEGVHSLGGGSSRALAGLRGDKGTPGISVDLREGSVDIDITMSIVFGSSVPTIAEACRQAVTEQVEGTTGLKVRAVNVLVTDVVFPEEQTASSD